MYINAIDHLVLTVRDIDATCDFYTRALGMQVITFGNNRKALQFGLQKINLHEHGKEFEPRALKPVPGSADVCFLTAIPLEQVIAHLQANSVTIEEGPVERSGATGTITSISVRDPDGNLIEIANAVA